VTSLFEVDKGLKILLVTVERETHIVQNFRSALCVQVADVLVGCRLNRLLLGVFLRTWVRYEWLIDTLAETKNGRSKVCLLLMTRHRNARRNLCSLRHLEVLEGFGEEEESHAVSVEFEVENG